MVTKTKRTVCHNTAKIKKLKKVVPSGEVLKEMAGSYKAIGHPGRFAILKILEVEKSCVCDISHTLEQPVSTVSQNLNILKKAGWINSKQEGKFVYYSLKKKIP